MVSDRASDPVAQKAENSNVKIVNAATKLRNLRIMQSFKRIKKLESNQNRPLPPCRIELNNHIAAEKVDLSFYFKYC